MSLLPGNAAAQRMDEATVLAMRFFFGVLFGGIQASIAYGSYSMIKLQNEGVAKTAAILSLIPLCSSCCVLGIPFGIWALVVMGNPAVSARFR